MNFKVKMIVTQLSRELKFIKSSLSQRILSNFEIRILEKGVHFPCYKHGSFFTDNRKEAFKIKKMINQSDNFRGKIYRRHGKLYLPFPIDGRRGERYIKEVLSLTTISTENKEDKCQKKD